MRLCDDVVLIHVRETAEFPLPICLTNRVTALQQNGHESEKSAADMFDLVLRCPQVCASLHAPLDISIVFLWSRLDSWQLGCCCATCHAFIIAYGLDETDILLSRGYRGGALSSE